MPMLFALCLFGSSCLFFSNHISRLCLRTREKSVVEETCTRCIGHAMEKHSNMPWYFSLFLGGEANTFGPRHVKEHRYIPRKKPTTGACAMSGIFFFFYFRFFLYYMIFARFCGLGPSMSFWSCSRIIEIMAAPLATMTDQKRTK